MAVFLVNSRGIDVFPGGVISTRAQFPRFLVPSYLSDSKGEKERRRVPVSLFIPLAFSLAVARARARAARITRRSGRDSLRSREPAFFSLPYLRVDLFQKSGSP